MPRKWNRSQKYHARPRHLYALVFSDGVYIGQTVNLTQRERQHRSDGGGWCGKHFRCLHLATIEGTEAEAVEHEHAWRLVAWKQGMRVFAKPPGIPCNPSRQTTWNRRQLARGLRWPESTPRGARRPWLVVLGTLAVLWGLAVLGVLLATWWFTG